MNGERYRHTQVGWVMIAVMFVLPLFFIPVMPILEYSILPLVFLIGILLAVGLFVTLTVAVDDERLLFFFSVGIIRKRIALADIRQFREVRNPWYYGWGIHMYPGGWIYNVSGLGAVELLLSNGKHIRIGTDEPAELCRTLARVLGEPAPLTAAETEKEQHATRKSKAAIAVLFALVALSIVGMGVAFYLEAKPPRVTVTGEAFAVESLMYGERFEMNEITDIALKGCIPPIIIRTNGFGGGRILRGHFKLKILGDGQLFITHGIPPYIVVRRGADFVIVNFEDPNRTREVFEDLKAEWPHMAREEECR